MLAFALLSALFAFGALAIHKGWMPGLLPVPFVLLGISLVSLALSAGDLLSANVQDGLIGALSGMPIVLVLFFYILRRRSVAKPDPNGIVDVDQVQPLVFDPKVFN